MWVYLTAEEAALLASGLLDEGPPEVLATFLWSGTDWSHVMESPLAGTVKR